LRCHDYLSLAGKGYFENYYTINITKLKAPGTGACRGLVGPHARTASEFVLGDIAGLGALGDALE
jgi:hypothetical protein